MLLLCACPAPRTAGALEVEPPPHAKPLRSTCVGAQRASFGAELLQVDFTLPQRLLGTPGRVWGRIVWGSLVPLLIVWSPRGRDLSSGAAQHWIPLSEPQGAGGKPPNIGRGGPFGHQRPPFCRSWGLLGHHPSSHRHSRLPMFLLRAPFGGASQVSHPAAGGPFLAWLGPQGPRRARPFGRERVPERVGLEQVLLGQMKAGSCRELSR